MKLLLTCDAESMDAFVVSSTAERMREGRMRRRQTTAWTSSMLDMQLVSLVLDRAEWTSKIQKACRFSDHKFSPPAISMVVQLAGGSGLIYFQYPQKKHECCVGNIIARSSSKSENNGTNTVHAWYLMYKVHAH